MKNMMKNTGRKIKKYVKEDPVGFISFVMILLFIFLAVFADFIAPYGINETQYMKPKAAPSMEHIFGTDELSRDIFSRILYASRISLFIGIVLSVYDSCDGDCLQFRSKYKKFIFSTDLSWMGWNSEDGESANIVSKK